MQNTIFSTAQLVPICYLCYLLLFVICNLYDRYMRFYCHYLLTSVSELSQKLNPIQQK